MSTLTLTTAPADGSDGGQGGWIGDHLHEPVDVLQHLLGYLREWAPIAGPVLVLGIVVFVVGQGWWRHYCHQRLLPDARVVTMLAPPTVDPAGGVSVWSNLVGLLHPAWKRWLLGQPHLVFEYVFSDAGVAIRFWVPGRIPPSDLDRLSNMSSTTTVWLWRDASGWHRRSPGGVAYGVQDHPPVGSAGAPVSKSAISGGQMTANRSGAVSPTGALRSRVERSGSRRQPHTNLVATARWISRTIDHGGSPANRG